MSKVSIVHRTVKIGNAFSLSPFSFSVVAFTVALEFASIALMRLASLSKLVVALGVSRALVLAVFLISVLVRLYGMYIPSRAPELGGVG